MRKLKYEQLKIYKSFPEHPSFGVFHHEDIKLMIPMCYVMNRSGSSYVDTSIGTVKVELCLSLFSYLSYR